MKFAQPIWLLAGLMACAALVWRYRRFDARQRAELQQFASESLLAQLTQSVSAARRRFKRALVVVGVACMAIALARPLVGFQWEEAKRRGLDLLFAVDTSKSMLAQDVKPDRLTRAKMAVEDLLARMDGDRVGLIAFAGNSFLQCPLTLDCDAFRQSLDALDTKIIPRGGTDIAAAIHEAEAALEGSGNHERILVLLTDGEDLEGKALDAARAAGSHGLRIFTVGIGSANGELIPVADEQGGTQFTKDAEGQFVKSRLDETMLKKIAEATGAMYQPLGQGQGLELIYQKGLAQFARRELASRTQKVYIERFQWPLGLGLLCLVMEPLIGIRRRRTAKKLAPATVSRFGAHGVTRLTTVRSRMRPAFAAASAVALMLALAHPASASVQSGEKAFQNGDYKKAEQDYGQAAAKHPEKPVLQFNHGSAAYKAGDYEAAAQSFAKAMKTDDPKLQQDNHYNLGNVQYRTGQKTEKANVQETIKNWEQSLKSYEAALQINKDDADAKYNRDFVKRKLELKKQQQQQQQQQQQNNQQQQNQDKQQDKNQQSQNQNNQNQQQNDKKDQKNDQNNQHNQQAGGSGQQDKQDQKQDKEQKNDQAKQEPNKEQNKQDQQPKSGSGQEQAKNDPKDQQDKQGNGSPQSQQDQKDGKEPQQKQNAQSGQKPEPQKKDGQIQPRNPQPADSSQELADASREPGKMSREEARQLLDSLKSGDRMMPLEPSPRGNGATRNDEPVKDW